MDRNYALCLGKLLIAVAWADGTLQKAELRLLREVLGELPRLTHEDWTALKLYMEYPLSPSEVQSVLLDFKKNHNDKKGHDFAVECIKKIIYADGQVDEGEVKLYKKIVEFLESEGDGAIGKLTGLFKATRTPFATEPTVIIGRERHLEDFMNNPIFFRFYRSINESGVASSLGKEELRKLCLAGGLLAKIAQADGETPDIEVNTMVHSLSSHLSVSPDISRAIVNTALSIEVALINVQRTCRRFIEVSSPEERKEFLEVLADIVKADGEVLSGEKQALYDIALGLRLPKELVMQTLRSLDEFEKKTDR